MQRPAMGLALGKKDAFRWQIVASIREHWLSNFAHRFSNVLFAAGGYVRMPLRNGSSGLSEADRRCLELALDNIHRLALLLRDLEVFPELQELDFTSFCIRDLLREVVARIRLAPETRHLDVRECLSGGSADTTGDRAKLGAALEEFLAAAARFAIPDGFLQISSGEANGLFAIKLTAHSERPRSGFQPDTAKASGVWQLHGGRVCMNHTEKDYILTCELPLIHFSQQPVLLRRRELGE